MVTDYYYDKNRNWNLAEVIERVWSSQILHWIFDQMITVNEQALNEFDYFRTAVDYNCGWQMTQYRGHNFNIESKPWIILFVSSYDVLENFITSWEIQRQD